ncbi:MAG: molybdopterin-binding protein [Thermodesulfobacteriota bacterium]
MLKKIRIEDAVGMRMAHDVTRIVPGKFKGVAFRRNHIIRKTDLPKLLDLGKKHIYVLELMPGQVHEDEAARRMARAVAGKGIGFRGPREGKIDFLAKGSGLLKVNVRRLRKINAIRLLILSTLHNHSCVDAGSVVAGTRSIPLTLLESKIKRVEEICRREGPVLEVLPFRKKKVGILATGSEIYEHRIKDRSSQILKKKVEAYGSRVVRSGAVTDDATRIAKEIKEMKSAGCELIITTGGLSVDPDDVTLEGIRKSGAEVIFYGVPILPGSIGRGFPERYHRSYCAPLPRLQGGACGARSGQKKSLCRLTRPPMDTEDIFKEIIKIKSQGERAALATVLYIKGRGPREGGAKMLVRSNGTSMGSMGGGGLEKEVYQEALRVIETGKPKVLTFKLHRDIESGFMSAGESQVFIEPIL